MRCFICDKELSTDEIIWNKDADEWEPCPECLIAISEVFADLSDEEITHTLEQEWGEDYISNVHENSS